MNITKTIERQLGFNNYEYLIKNVDVVNKANYQKKFNSFYRVRSKTKGWYEIYYKYFYSIKDNKTISFDMIIDYLFENLPKTKKGNNLVEASFSSKMLATINPEMPILDSKVLDKMNLNKDGSNPQEKLKQAKKTYSEICFRYSRFYQTSDFKKVESIFDQAFPDYKWVSKAKKVDWFMYGMTKKELAELGNFSTLING